MSKKKTKQQIDSQGDEGRENDKKQQFFQCKCGKKYGSLAAVHTHINNKHNSDKKQYKIGIKNPKKTGQGPSTSIRMKDIAYNQQEADLMCLADTALKNIYDFMKKENMKAQDFLLDQNVIDSCQQLDDDEDQDDIGLIPRPKGKRDKQIDQLVKDLKDQYEIQQIDNLVQNTPQFQAFKIDKFKLSLVKELIKFFNLQYASKIQLQLEIIASKRKLNNDKGMQKLNSIQEQIWGSKIQIRKQLESYYSDWVRLKKKQYKAVPLNK